MRGAYLWKADLRGAYLQDAYLQDAYLQDAYLRGANLRGANLQKADLWKADLRGANLQAIRYYSEIHEVFQEVVRQQKCDTFSEKEWSIIGKICIHRLCWGTIKNKFGAEAMPVFERLADKGWGEWLGRYRDIIKGN